MTFRPCSSRRLGGEGRRNERAPDENVGDGDQGAGEEHPLARETLLKGDAGDLNVENCPRQRPRRREFLAEAGFFGECKTPEVGMRLDYSGTRKEKDKQNY